MIRATLIIAGLRYPFLPLRLVRAANMNDGRG